MEESDSMAYWNGSNNDSMVNLSNRTMEKIRDEEFEDTMDLQTLTIVYSFSIVLSFLFTMSIAFNSISIVAILTARVFTPINLLIMNLAVADLTYTLGIPMFIAHTFLKSWPFGELGCKLFICTEFFGIVVGVLTVAALSVERYFEVVDKKKRANHLSSKFKNFIVLAYIIISWIAAVIYTIPFTGGIKKISFANDNVGCGTEWTDRSVTIYFTLKFFFVFVIPYMVIIISSVKLLLFLAAWKRRDHAIRRCSTSYMAPSESIASSSEQQQMQRFVKLTSKHLKSSEASSFSERDKKHFKKSKKAQRSTNQTTTTTTVRAFPKIRNEFSAVSEADADAEVDSSYLQVESCKTSDNNSTRGSKYISSTSSVTENEVRPMPSLSTVSVLYSSNTRRLMSLNNYTTSVRQKASCLVLIIILLFLIQWSPLCIFQSVVLFSEDFIANVQLINLAVSTLSYSNTVANPILYMLLTYNFKLYFKKTLQTNRSIQNMLTMKKRTQF